MTELTLEAVAAAAGVSRVTMYNHFGSRRSLWQAVFAEVGRRMHAERIHAALRADDPLDAMLRVLDEAARAWHRQARAVTRIFALGELDAELGKAVAQSERARRASLLPLAERLKAARVVGPRISASEAAALLGALTSFQAYQALAAAGSASTVRARLRSLSCGALGIIEGAGRSVLSQMDDNRKMKGNER